MPARRRIKQCIKLTLSVAPVLWKMFESWFAIVRSLVTDAFNHAPGQIMMNTGSQQFGRPSIGAWTTYGLGSQSRDLPGFVVLNSAKKGTSGGQFQVAHSTSSGGTFTNVGGVQNGYAGSNTYVTVNLGNVTFGSSGTKYFRFRVTAVGTGSGYQMFPDFIEVTRQ